MTVCLSHCSIAQWPSDEFYLCAVVFRLELLCHLFFLHPFRPGVKGCPPMRCAFPSSPVWDLQKGVGGGWGQLHNWRNLCNANFGPDLGPMLAARSLASSGALTAGQPIDGLNIDANSVSSIQLPIRTRFRNKGASGG